MTILTSLTEILERVADIMEFGAGLFFVISLLVISRWFDRIFFYAISGFCTIALALTWGLNYEGFNIALVGIASYQLMKAVINALESKSPNKGISQFRGVISRIRSWF